VYQIKRENEYCQPFVDGAVNFIRAKTRVTSHLPTSRWANWCLRYEQLQLWIIGSNDLR